MRAPHTPVGGSQTGSVANALDKKMPINASFSILLLEGKSKLKTEKKAIPITRAIENNFLFMITPAVTSYEISKYVLCSNQPLGIAFLDGMILVLNLNRFLLTILRFLF